MRCGKPDIVTAGFLFDQLLEVNINCILGKTGFHRDPSGTPGSLLLLPEQLRSFVCVVYTLGFSTRRTDSVGLK